MYWSCFNLISIYLFGLRIEGSFMINFLLQIDYFMHILANDLLSNSMII